MPPRRALSYLEPVLMALSAAHDAHLIHRDIKPENVLISTTGEVKLADFGLARAVSNDSTGGGVLVGTVSYLAPEVITHQGADPRSDVYACGAMLFEMLTGAKPHAADSPIAVAHKHVNEDVSPPSQLQPGIPPYLDALVLRAMARDRAQRSPDARVLLHQLRQVQRALAAGLADDPELTRDLLPGAGPTPAELPHLDPFAADTEPTAPVTSAYAPAYVTAGDGMPTTSVPEPTTTLGAPTTQAVAPAETAPPVTARRRRGPLLLVLALAALAATALLGWYLAIGRYDTVPNLVALSQDEAVKTAEAAGFTTEVGSEEYSEVVEKGAVISTDPEPGSRLLPDETIALTLSLGKERYAVPNIQGRTLEEAETILGATHLRVGDVTKAFSDSIPTDGIIRSSSHKVGDEVKRDTAIDLVVSKGPKPIDIADYTGKSADTAAAALQKAGFEVSRIEKFSETVPAGNVISQTPKSGTGHKGDTITLTVSKGPERVAVPDIDGMTEEQARNALAAVGLKLNATRNPFSGDDATVKYQTPGAGSKAKIGSSVTVFLS